MPPDNAKVFYASLKNCNLDLSNFKYAVFGTGNSQWNSTFQKIPKFIDQRLSELKANRLVQFIGGDEDDDQEHG